jgi:rubrerythrin
MHMASIDYKNLSLKDALDIAIIIEDDARERYRELAEQLEQHNTAEAAEFFRFMVENETKHGDQLRKQRADVFGDAPQEVSGAAVPEVEIADYDAARAFMSVHSALRVAMANEVRAHDFYDEALKYVTDPQVKELFTELRAEEVDHQDQIKKVQDKLPPEDKTNPDDFADEPVAH